MLYVATQLLTFRLGIIPADEGFATLTPLRLLQGERPYLDFWWLYGPTGLFLNAGLYRIFGVSLITLRLAGVAAGYAALLLCWRLAMRFMTPGWAGVAATVALALYRLPTYNYNHMYAAVAGLLALECALRARETGRVGWWAGAGALVGLLCSLKFNVGVQAGAAVALFAWMAARGGRTHALAHFAGAWLAMLVAQNVALLAWLGRDALPAIYGPQFAVAAEKMTAWALWSNLAASVPRSLSREGIRQAYYLALFLLPVIVPPAAWWLARRERPAARDAIRLLALYSPAVYVQAFIVADPSGSTGDNAALLITSLLLLVYVLGRWAGARQGKAARALAFGAALAVVAVVYGGALVRYATPGKYDYTLTLERARGVRVSSTYGANLEGAVRFTQAHVPEGEAIAAVPWAGEMLAFLSGRRLAARDTGEFLGLAPDERPAWVVLTNAPDPMVDYAGLVAAVEADYRLAAEFGDFTPVADAERRQNPRWEDRLAYRVYR
ncbi:MAG: glycosyltransferase family 39 protein [Anaerolineae bacterium]|nr:glycosyltransferase family 39 protein [Anaerolineae bacterium]